MIRADSPEITPRVSVITPVYNGAGYIAEVIAAISQQTYDRLEHIIVDDGSTDDTASIIKTTLGTAEKRPVHIIHQKNAGEAAAVNAGLASALGEYIVVINADDPPMPQLVEQLVDLLDITPTAVVAYPDWEKIDANGNIIKIMHTLPYSREALIGDFRCIPGPGAMIRACALNGEPLRSSDYKYVSDFELWLRLSMRGTMVRCPHVLARWRRHASGATATGQGLVLAREFEAVIETFFNRGDLPEDVRQLERQAKAMVAYYAGFQKVFDSSVPGCRLMLRSLFTPFRRPRGYITVKRNPLAVLAPFTIPVSTWAFKRFGYRWT